jgi:hypothetical protein
MLILDNNSNHKIDSITKLQYYIADLFSRGSTSPLHIFVTFSQTSIEKLPALADRMDRSIKLESVGEDIYEIRIRLKKRGAMGWLVTKNDVWIFYVKGEESSTVGSVTDTWISGMNPFISHARLPPSGLFDLLDSLDNIVKNGIIIQDYLARSYRHDKGFETASDWMSQSQKAWTGDKYDRKKLEKTMAVTDTALYAAKIQFPDQETSFSARVSRRGHITFYEGEEKGFFNFYERLVDNYILKAVEYRRTLDNKQVQVIEEKPLVPNQIIFSIKKPLVKLDFELLIDALTAEPDYMVSVVYVGNPWLYVTVIDRADGNTCEIYGFEDEVQVIPQFKATTQGLARLEDLLYGVIPSLQKQEKNK